MLPCKATPKYYIDYIVVIFQRCDTIQIFNFLAISRAYQCIFQIDNCTVQMSSKGSILVTGSNGGLGSAIAAQIVSSAELAAHHGIYTARNAASASALDAALRGSRSGPAAPPHSYEKISLDLSRLSSVREVAAGISSRVAAGQIPPIRAIILNAGVEEFATQTWTGDGLDLTFATNYLGHWLLTLMLLGSMDRDRGRIL